MCCNVPDIINSLLCRLPNPWLIHQFIDIAMAIYGPCIEMLPLEKADFVISRSITTGGTGPSSATPRLHPSVAKEESPGIFIQTHSTEQVGNQAGSGIGVRHVQTMGSAHYGFGKDSMTAMCLNSVRFQIAFFPHKIGPLFPTLPCNNHRFPEFCSDIQKGRSNAILSQRIQADHAKSPKYIQTNIFGHLKTEMLQHLTWFDSLLYEGCAAYQVANISFCDMSKWMVWDTENHHLPVSWRKRAAVLQLFVFMNSDLATSQWPSAWSGEPRMSF